MHVVGDHDAAGLELLAREREERVVVVLLGVEEDDVEDVVERLKRLEGVSLDELDPVPSRPASATFRRHASADSGFFSSESTRPPRWRTPAPSQIDE